MKRKYTSEKSMREAYLECKREEGSVLIHIEYIRDHTGKLLAADVVAERHALDWSSATEIARRPLSDLWKKRAPMKRIQKEIKKALTRRRG
jgi:hypothetical protein